jgi:hypothetical protein
MKATPQKAIDAQGQIAPNIEFKKPYYYQPNTAQMIHYYANNLHYLGGDPVPPLNDPSLLPHAPVITSEDVFISESTLRPIRGEHDCEWSETDNYFLSAGATLTPGRVSVSGFYRDINMSFLFSNVQIGYKKTIESAYFFYVGAQTPNAYVVNTNIYANNIDSAVAPTDAISGQNLSKTASFISWNGISTETDVVYKSPNLKTVIQSIVDRPSWEYENNLQLIWETTCTTGNNKRIYAFETSVDKSPKLIITVKP